MFPILLIYLPLLSLLIFFITSLFPDQTDFKCYSPVCTTGNACGLYSFCVTAPMETEASAAEVIGAMTVDDATFGLPLRLREDGAPSNPAN